MGRFSFRSLNTQIPQVGREELCFLLPPWACPRAFSTIAKTLVGPREAANFLSGPASGHKVHNVLFRVRENHRPDQVRDVAHEVRLAEPEPGAEVGVDPKGAVPRGSHGLPLVELDPVLDPGLVEMMRGLVKDKLELCGRLAFVFPLIMRKRLEPLPPRQKPRQWRQTYPPRVSPFFLSTISQGETELNTRPHSIRAQKTWAILSPAVLRL